MVGAARIRIGVGSNRNANELVRRRVENIAPARVPRGCETHEDEVARVVKLEAIGRRKRGPEASWFRFTPLPGDPTVAPQAWSAGVRHILKDINRSNLPSRIDRCRCVSVSKDQ